MLNLRVASTNAGKLRDFSFAAGGDVSIAPLANLASIPAPDETEETFEGNARLKAAYYSWFAPLEIVVADDSGLEVDALGGAPGVRSARYADDSNFLAGSQMPLDERNNRCLLAALQGISSGERTARYRCVLAAARGGRVVALGEGLVEGMILSQARGSGGFGYDPYFSPAGLEQSMAELDPETRLRLSHRGRALRDLLSKLRSSGVNLTV